MSLKEDVEKINETVEQTSFAYELLLDARKINKRMFIIILVILGMWFATIGYLAYVLNDIGTIETTQEISDVESIGGNVVNNGDVYGENKANN